MKQIRLYSKKYPGHYALVDDADYEWLIKYRWVAVKHRNDIFYAVHVASKKKHIVMHRVILGLEDSKHCTDHINHNGLDNRKENLRICTHAENSRNVRRSSSNTSTLKGSSWSKSHKKWQAVIRKDRKLYHLGYYATKELAHEAYCKASPKFHGEFGNKGQDATRILHTRRSK